MAQDTSRHLLPGKVDQLLATLSRLYERQDKKLLQQIVVNSQVTVHEEWDVDNWNGGTYGHAITLTVFEQLFLEMLDFKEEFQRQINDDINSLNNVRNEHISEVFIEMQPAASEGWRENSGVLRNPQFSVSPTSDDAKRIWGAYPVRIFLSHKSSVKKSTSSLKVALAACGISAFVAHEDIEPTEEWHREIERALFSMDALVALLTEDYHDSNWTDQEVGVAMGRGVPLIAVRLGCDPYGLMGKSQALTGCNLNDPVSLSLKIFRLLHKRLPDKSQLFESALSVYSKSSDWANSAWSIKNVLAQFDTVGSNEVTRIMQAYEANSQNKYSFEGREALIPLLNKWTGKKWVIANDSLRNIDEI